jgi:metal-responsive CopG/Arc/MetJ family transcriptional regulator
MFSASTERDQDVIGFIEGLSKGVRSNFIREAIRAKINGNDLESKIRRIVAEELSKNESGDVANALKSIFE